MPLKLRSKTTIESPDSRYDVVEAKHEGRVPALVEQIENLMNSLEQQQGNPSNSPIEQVEGRDAGNVDVSIILFNNSNEKNQQVIMTAFMKEMKQQLQSILENLRERGQPRQEIAPKPERQFSNKLRE